MALVARAPPTPGPCSAAARRPARRLPAGACCAWRSAASCTRAAELPSAAAAAHGGEAGTSSSSAVPLSAVAPLALPLALAPAARADDLEAILQVASSEDLLTGGLFAAVVVGLSVITAGVLYINLSQWLDSRQETEDRLELKKALVNKSLSKCARAEGLAGALGAAARPAAAPPRRRRTERAPRCPAERRSRINHPPLMPRLAG